MEMLNDVNGRESTNFMEMSMGNGDIIEDIVGNLTNNIHLDVSIWWIQTFPC